MPKFVLTNDDNVDPMLQLPDLRGFPRDAVRAGAKHLERVYGLPDCVAVRALLRTVPVYRQIDGSVVIDDEAVVLRPKREYAIRLLREVVVRRPDGIECGG